MLHTYLNRLSTQDPCRQRYPWKLLHGCPSSVFQRAAHWGEGEDQIQLDYDHGTTHACQWGGLQAKRPALGHGFHPK